MPLAPLTLACFCSLAAAVPAQHKTPQLAAPRAAGVTAPRTSPAWPAGTGSSALAAFTGADDCAQAALFPISGTGTFLVSTVGATSGAPFQLCQTAFGLCEDVWYYWIAPTTGSITIDTCGSTSCP